MPPRMPPPLHAETAIAIVQRWAYRASLRARTRTVWLALDALHPGASLMERVLWVILPWGVKEYPGRERALREVCGRTSRHTFFRWKKTGLPPDAAERLARFLEDRVERELALVAELRADAVRRKAAYKPPGFVAATPEDRLAWWDVRRQKEGERSAKRHPKAGPA